MRDQHSVAGAPSLMIGHLEKRALAKKIMKWSLPTLALLSLTGLTYNLVGEFDLSRFTLNLIALCAVSTSWAALLRDRVALSIHLVLYTALVLFSLSTILNGGVRTPNYVGFLGVLVLSSVIYSSKMMWRIYAVFVALGAFCTFILPESSLFLPSHRYFTIYCVFGLVITMTLIYTRDAYNNAVNKLAEREGLLSSILESIEDPLIIVDSEVEVAYLNQRAQRLDDDFRRAYAVGLFDHVMFEMSLKEEHSLRALIHTSAQQNQTFKVHFNLNRRPQWFSISVAPHMIDNTTAGAVVIMRDITEQQRLTQSQKMEAVGRLSNGIAHDFNNMLGAIKSANDLLMLDVDEEHHDLLEVIEEATDRSADMIKQLRLFSRRSDHEMSSLNIGAMILDVRTLLQSMNEHRLSIEVQLPEEPIFIQGIPEQIQAMLLNLGLNGLQAMDRGGKLTLTARPIDMAEGDLRLESTRLRHGQYLCLEVQDEGVGVSPDLQERIFEPFFTLRDHGEGQGLGLSIVHGAVQRHQGVIEVESQVGVGTTMRVFLPISETLKVDSTPVELLSDNIELNELQVLVIDDENLIRDSLAAMLKTFGIQVTVTASGDEGLAILKDQLALNGVEFDLLILDMLMPEKSGYDVFLELQELSLDLPVILSSGYYPEEALDEMLKLGLAGQLHKPYGLKEVKRAMIKALSHRVPSSKS